MKITTLLKYIGLFIFTVGTSQTNFKKGMYTSWENLVQNTPDLNLKSNVVYKKVMNDQQKTEPHRIAVVKSTSDKEILAFSNGEELFFNAQQPDLKSKPYFNHVTMYGNRYGIYSSLFVIAINKEIGLGNFPMHCSVKGIELIDFEKKNITKILNSSDLKAVIKDDTELLKRFKKENKKHLKIRVYLLEYLIRNS